MEKSDIEGMEMDNDEVDGNGKNNKEYPSSNNHDRVNNGDESTGGDMPDMVSPLALASMVLRRPSSSSPPTTETSDSKKILDVLRRRLTGVSGEVDEGPFASCDPHDFYYNMNHKNRGKAIIFNHSDFDRRQGLSPRPGTAKDAADVKCSLERLGFDVEIYNDLKFEKMYGILEKEALFNHKDDDCIIVVVLTHGGHNHLNAYDFEYKPEVLWKLFSADNCPSLAGKPKMFFIQACRGETYDEGTMLLSPHNNKSRTVVDGPGDGKTYKIPNHADFLMVFSTTPACEMTISDNRTLLSRLFEKFLSLSHSGHYSWRNSYKGGCFIQALCLVLDTYAWEMDLLSLLTLVNKEVAIRYESNVPRDVTQNQKKQIPHVSHTLTRKIQFFPKSAKSTLV